MTTSIMLWGILCGIAGAMTLYILGGGLVGTMIAYICGGHIGALLMVGQQCFTPSNHDADHL